jgi:hypothetical protein
VKNIAEVHGITKLLRYQLLFKIAKGGRRYDQGPQLLTKTWYPTFARNSGVSIFEKLA